MIYKIINQIKKYPSLIYFVLFVLLVIIYVSPGNYLDAFIDFFKAYWFRYSRWWLRKSHHITPPPIYTCSNIFSQNGVYTRFMSKLPNPREIVLDKEVNVSNGIKGHQHREKNQLKKKYFEIHDLEIWYVFPCFHSLCYYSHSFVFYKIAFCCKLGKT